MSARPLVALPPAPIIAPIVDALVPTTGCGARPAITPGTTGVATLTVDPAADEGMAVRTYRVHVPAGYNGRQLTPVVLAFHGHGMTAAGMERLTHFSALSDRQGFLAVYPQALPVGPSKAPFWASAGPVVHGIDDVRYVSNLLDALQRAYCVDPRRIYATGFSNGGGMAGYLACVLSRRIAAFAPVAGNVYVIPSACDPGRPVAILDFHGTADRTVPYVKTQSPTTAGSPLSSIQSWLTQWAARDGCASTPLVFYRNGQLTGMRWSGCQGGVEVVHYREQGARHVWPAPRADGLTAAQVIWQFFQAHPLPAA
jgi:polyhydroxybutyrate depolymerase